MPLIRTARGLQWTSVEPEPQPTVERTPSAFERALSVSKDFLPWIAMVVPLCSWFGVKYLSSDRMQQQQLEDHIAITEMRKEVRGIATDQAAISAKFDLYIALRGK